MPVGSLLWKVFSAIWAAKNLNGTASVKDCGVGTSLFQVQAVSLVPETASAGQEMTLHLEYDVPEGVVITDGTAEFQPILNGLPFQPTVEPLCQQVPCPLGPGSYQNDTVSTWPTGITGKLETKMYWYDADGKELLCIDITGRY
jgi:ML domain